MKKRVKKCKKNTTDDLKPLTNSEILSENDENNTTHTVESPNSLSNSDQKQTPLSPEVTDDVMHPSSIEYVQPSSDGVSPSSPSVEKADDNAEPNSEKANVRPPYQPIQNRAISPEKEHHRHHHGKHHRKSINVEDKKKIRKENQNGEV